MQHSSRRVMVFGSAKAGKSTLINRMTKRKVRLFQRAAPNLSTVEWLYAPSSSMKPIKFIMWDFNQVTILYCSSMFLIIWYLGCHLCHSSLFLLKASALLSCIQFGRWWKGSPRAGPYAKKYPSELSVIRIISWPYNWMFIQL